MAEDSDAPNTEDEQSGSPPGDIDWKARYEAELERAKTWRGKAEENESAADELSALKESQLSETQRLEARAARAEKELNDLKTAQQRLTWRGEAAKKTGVPVDLLRGETAEEINAHAQAIKTYMAAQIKPSAAKVADPAGTPDVQPNPNVGLLKQLFGGK
jgi:chromosome segregation ATPase